ncbi:hypothetical protein HAHE_23420 [Haloferula helveola]|uniref:Uncharacterized protein n=1 Tax=Haloferula helveola TaxID=490095 RepID=A0ABM7RAL1_9BACT|nr:hypothetical protein HAHE_23420 [Haloferula helveola]
MAFLVHQALPAGLVTQSAADGIGEIPGLRNERGGFSGFHVVRLIGRSVPVSSNFTAGFQCRAYGEPDNFAL